MDTAGKLNFLTEAIKTIKGTVPDQPITLDTVLEDIKVDSLDAVELQMYYEEKMGVDTLDPVKPVKTVGDLIQLMP